MESCTHISVLLDGFRDHAAKLNLIPCLFHLLNNFFLCRTENRLYTRLVHKRVSVWPVTYTLDFDIRNPKLVGNIIKE